MTPSQPFGGRVRYAIHLNGCHESCQDDNLVLMLSCVAVFRVCSDLNGVIVYFVDDYVIGLYSPTIEYRTTSKAILYSIITMKHRAMAGLGEMGRAFLVGIF